MDSVKLNKEGAAPIKEEMAAIHALKDKEEIYTYIAESQKKGIRPYFTMFVSADDMNSSMNMVQTYQGGLGMDSVITIWRMTSRQRVSAINIRSTSLKCSSWPAMTKLPHRKQWWL